MKIILLFISLGIVTLFGFSKFTRGNRNNNPGNLIDSGDNWRGLSEVRNDGKFYRFKSKFFGTRALGITLLNFEKIHGLNTVNGIINRYAPPNENDTDAYQTFVSEKIGIDKNIEFNVGLLLPQLMKSIIKFENGKNIVPNDILQSAVAAARSSVI
jgi:hypothetical protein